MPSNWTTAIWGFIASIAAACFFAWLNMTQPSPLADLYLAGAIIFGIAAFVMRGWPLMRPRVKVASHLLILIGLVGGVVSLALVAVGFAWQTFWPLSSTVAAAPSSSDQPATAARRLSPSDIDERIRALSVAHNIALRVREFSEKYQPVGIRERLWLMIKDGKAPEFLETMAKELEPIQQDLEKFAKIYREWLADVDRALLGV